MVGRAQPHPTDGQSFRPAAADSQVLPRPAVLVPGHWRTVVHKHHLHEHHFSLALDSRVIFEQRGDCTHSDRKWDRCTGAEGSQLHSAVRGQQGRRSNCVCLVPPSSSANSSLRACHPYQYQPPTNGWCLWRLRPERARTQSAALQTSRALVSPISIRPSPKLQTGSICNTMLCQHFYLGSWSSRATNPKLAGVFKPRLPTEPLGGEPLTSCLPPEQSPWTRLGGSPNQPQHLRLLCQGSPPGSPPPSYQGFRAVRSSPALPLLPGAC